MKFEYEKMGDFEVPKNTIKFIRVFVLLKNKKEPREHTSNTLQLYHQDCFCEKKFYGSIIFHKTYSQWGHGNYHNSKTANAE